MHVVSIEQHATIVWEMGVDDLRSFETNMRGKGKFGTDKRVKDLKEVV